MIQINKTESRRLLFTICIINNNKYGREEEENIICRFHERQFIKILNACLIVHFTEKVSILYNKSIGFSHLFTFHARDIHNRNTHALVIRFFLTILQC